MINRYCASVVGAGLIALASGVRAELSEIEKKVQKLEHKIHVVQSRIDSTGIDSTDIAGRQVLRDLRLMIAQRDSLAKKADEERKLREAAAQKDTVTVDKTVYPSVVVEGYFGSNGFKGTRIGLGAGFEWGNVAATVGASNGRTVKDVSIPLPDGNFAEGSEKETKTFNYGVNLEAYFNRENAKRIFGGVGIQKVNYTEKIREAIRNSGGELVQPNSNSVGRSRVSLNSYVGLKLPVNLNVSLRIFAGYENIRGGYGGLGIKYTLQKTTPRK